MTTASAKKKAPKKKASKRTAKKSRLRKSMPEFAPDCARCGALPGRPCTGEQGQPLKLTHAERRTEALAFEEPKPKKGKPNPALIVACPSCSAAKGEPCVGRSTHRERRVRAQLEPSGITYLRRAIEWGPRPDPDLVATALARNAVSTVECPQCVAVRGEPCHGPATHRRRLKALAAAEDGGACGPGRAPTDEARAERLAKLAATCSVCDAGPGLPCIATRGQRAGQVMVWGVHGARGRDETGEAPPEPAPEPAPQAPGKMTHEKAAVEGPGSSTAAATATLISAVRIAHLRRDGGTQTRAVIDDAVVSEYAEAYADGAQLPPPVAFYDGEAYWLADGFHRLAALERIQRVATEVLVHQGTRRDAVLFACGANASHGLRRTRADRRRAVETLLRDEEWGRRADRWIAKQCGVSPTTVGTIRAEVSNLDTSESGAETREGQDGKLYPSRPSPTDPIDDASPAGLLLPFEDEAAEPPPKLRNCGLSGRPQCTWCGARWPDEVLPGIGGPPSPCPRCQVRDPALRDPAPDELEAAAKRWWDKRTRGDVPELPPLDQPKESHGSEDDRNDRAGGSAETARGTLHDGAGEPEGAPRRQVGGQEVAEGGEAPRQGAGEVAPGGSLRDPGGSHSDPVDPSRIKARTWRDVLELPKGRIDPELIIEHHIRLSADLGLSEAEASELDRARAVGLSQWQTMPREAERMVELAAIGGDDAPTILEPSAGGGALVAAVRRANPAAHITAHEVDPVFAERLRQLPKNDRPDVVHEGDFLAWPAPSRRYDLAIVNSPYEGGADGAFLARCMDSANAVVALLRLNALTGTGRYESVWSRVDSLEWLLEDQVILRSRPGFVGPGEDGAKSDYVIVRLLRRKAHATHSGFTRVSWL